jgi:aminopeptidase YwaD
MNPPAASPPPTTVQADPAVRRALAFVDEVIRGFPGRHAGSPSCRGAASRIREAYSSACDAGTVREETFEFHPEAFIGYLPILAIVYVAAVVLMFLGQPLLAALGLAVALTLFACQGLLYGTVFDFLFRAATGTNVHGKVEPAGEVEQQIIVAGHHDAAPVFRYFAEAPRWYPLIVGIGFSCFGIALAGALYMTVTGSRPLWLCIALAVGTIGVIPIYRFFTGEISPGAGDNLIATAIAGEVARRFSDRKRAGQGLQHTRVICLSADAEECGLRGSRAWVRSHQAELLETRTYVVCLDTLYWPDQLHVIERDMNGLVPLSGSLARALDEVARDKGVRSRLARMPFGAGATDAASFSRAGVEAVSLIACEVSYDLPGDFVYHTLRDTTDAIDPRAVEQVHDVVVEYILRRDRASTRSRGGGGSGCAGSSPDTPAAPS